MQKAEGYVCCLDELQCDGCNIANMLSKYADCAMSHFSLMDDGSTDTRHRRSVVNNCTMGEET